MDPVKKEEDEFSLSGGSPRRKSRNSRNSRKSMSFTNYMGFNSLSKKRRGGCSASMSGGSALAGGAPADMQGMQGGADVLGYDAKSSLGYSMYGGRGSRRRRMSRRRRGKPRAMSTKFFPQGIFRGIMPRMSK